MPPYFVPPTNARRSIPETSTVARIEPHHFDAKLESRLREADTRPIESVSDTFSRPLEDSSGSLDDLAAATALLSNRQAVSQESVQRDRMPRSPSPQSPQDRELDHERRRNWSDSARGAFHVMITAPGYINRYRLNPKKRQLMLHYLRNPDVVPMNPDGTKDHQSRYQAAHWTLSDGSLYRKPDSGRVGKLRRHLNESEVWDVLTTKHLCSGAHLGRDKLRKRLEGRFIGYTLQEIMFVLRECQRCGGRKGATDKAERADDGTPITLPRFREDHCLADETSSGTSTAGTEHSVPRRPFERRQVSNFMLP